MLRGFGRNCSVVGEEAGVFFGGGGGGGGAGIFFWGRSWRNKKKSTLP